MNKPIIKAILLSSVETPNAMFPIFALSDIFLHHEFCGSCELCEVPSSLFNWSTGLTKELQLYSTVNEEKKNTKKTVNALRARNLCRSCFAGIVQLSSSTIWVHSTEVSPNSVCPNKPRFSSRRKDKLSLNTKIGIKFLHSYCAEYGLACSSGRGQRRKSKKLASAGTAPEMVY